MGLDVPSGVSVPPVGWAVPMLGSVTLCPFHSQCLSMRRRLWGKVRGGGLRGDQWGQGTHI